MSEKIKAHHLERGAYVYVRQSTPHQVRSHLESKERQYALAARAEQLGFHKVVVIDEDLGCWVAGATWFRPAIGVSLPRLGRGGVGPRSFAASTQQSRLASFG